MVSHFAFFVFCDNLLHQKFTRRTNCKIREDDFNRVSLAYLTLIAHVIFIHLDNTSLTIIDQSFDYSLFLYISFTVFIKTINQQNQE